MQLKNTTQTKINQCQQNYKVIEKEILVPNIGDFKNAFKYLQKSIDYFRETNDTLLLIKSLDHTGTIFIHQGQFEKAYEYFNEQYDLSINVDAKAGIHQ